MQRCGIIWFQLCKYAAKSDVICECCDLHSNIYNSSVCDQKLIKPALVRVCSGAPCCRGRLRLSKIKKDFLVITGCTFEGEHFILISISEPILHGLVNPPVEKASLFPSMNLM